MTVIEFPDPGPTAYPSIRDEFGRRWTWALVNSRLRPTLRHVALVLRFEWELCRFPDYLSPHQVTIGLGEFADSVGLTRRTVRRSLSELVGAGFARERRIGPGVWEYRLSFPDDPALARVARDELAARRQS